MFLMHLGLKTGPLCPIMILGQGSPVLLQKFQMVPRLKTLNILRVQKEGTEIYMSEASHSHRMWTEVSSPVLHLLHEGLVNTIK